MRAGGWWLMMALVVAVTMMTTNKTSTIDDNNNNNTTQRTQQNNNTAHAMWRERHPQGYIYYSRPSPDRYTHDIDMHIIPTCHGGQVAGDNCAAAHHPGSITHTSLPAYTCYGYACLQSSFQSGILPIELTSLSPSRSLQPRPQDSRLNRVLPLLSDPVSDIEWECRFRSVNNPSILWPPTSRYRRARVIPMK